MQNYNNRPKTQQPTRDEQGELHCPICGSPLVMKQGQYGDFLGCTGYATNGCTYKISASKVAGAIPESQATPVQNNKTTSTSTPVKTYKKAGNIDDLRRHFDEVKAMFQPEIDAGFLSGEDIRAMAIHLNMNK